MNQTAFSSFGLFFLRVALGVIFIAHGGQKTFGWWGGPGIEKFVGGMQSMGFDTLFAYLVAYGELAGGVAVILGFLTRFAGLGLAIIMGGAIWMVHLKNGFFLNLQCLPDKANGIEYCLSLLGMSVALLFTGAGRISFDCAIRRKPVVQETESLS